MTYKRHYQYLDRRRCYTAFPPLSANTGRPLQRAWSHLSQWKERESVFLANGVPDSSIMLDASHDGYLHIPMRPPDPTDAPAHERQYGVHIWEWPKDWAVTGDVRYADLIPDYVNFPLVTQNILSYPEATYTAATYGDEAVLFAKRYNDMMIPSNSGGWWHAAIRLHKVIMAACSIAPFPPPPPLIPGQEQCQSSEFGVGRVIRGHDAGVCEGSLGTITRLIGDGAGTDEDAECLTRRLLFSWAHPVGLWYDTMSASVVIWNEIPRVLTRNLRGLVGHQHVVEPVVVVTGDEGVVFGWVNPTNATTWTHTIPAGGYAVPTMVTPAMGDVGSNLTITDGTETLLTFGATGPTDAEEVLFHTVQLWEGSAWP
jgi:hypothetical protein